MFPVKVEAPKAIAHISKINELNLLAGGASIIVYVDAQPHPRLITKPLTWLIETFQARVMPWMEVCFGPRISADTSERNHRFIEEALELVQAGGMLQSEAHQLVDYVYGRPVGELKQEVGGVMVTLAALCLANRVDMHDCGETELARIWTKVEQIRAKQAAKPKHSPLPEQTRIAPVATDEIPGFPTMLRKMWSSSEVQQWINDNIMPLVYEIRNYEFHATEPTGSAHDLQGLADNLVTLQALPRDENGHFYHPAMPAFDEGVRRDVFLAALGLEYAFVDMESDAPHLMDNEGDGEHKLDEWMPTTPEIPSGDNRAAWALIEISDTEDGPYAMFVRRESPPEFTDRMHSRRWPEWINRKTMPGDVSSSVVFRAHYAGLENMRLWMLGNMPSALRAIAYGISFPPLPAWVCNPLEIDSVQAPVERQENAVIQFCDELTPRTPGEKAAYLEGIEEGKVRANRDRKPSTDPST